MFNKMVVPTGGDGDSQEKFYQILGVPSSVNIQCDFEIKHVIMTYAGGGITTVLEKFDIDEANPYSRKGTNNSSSWNIYDESNTTGYTFTVSGDTMTLNTLTLPSITTITICG